MSTESATFYTSVSTDVELEIRVTAREFTGIDSDPRVRLRVPTLEELHGCLTDVKLGNFRFFQELDFPAEVQVGGAA